MPGKLEGVRQLWQQRSVMALESVGRPIGEKNTYFPLPSFRVRVSPCRAFSDQERIVRGVT